MVLAHPTDDVLLEYASGSLGDGMSLLVASHLTYCPDCRRTVQTSEAIGGAVLASGALSTDGLDFTAVLARIDKSPETASEPALSDDPDSPLPRPLSSAIGTKFSDIRWRPRLRGLSEHVISEERAADGLDLKVSLLRAKPGVKIPEHTHKGDEATLVLCGALEDGGAVYRRGDVSLSDEHHDHQPRILDEGICICLIVLNGGLHFTGTFGRALNLFN